MARLSCALTLLLVGCVEEAAELGWECRAKEARSGDTLLVAGSGTGLAPIRHLIESYEAPVQLAESIGSSGAISALADGAIDVGLVSRPLTAEERAMGLREVPLATVSVGAARRAGLPPVDRETWLAYVRGEATRWPDGTPVILLLREPSDSATRLLARDLGIARAFDEARRDGRGLVLYTDQEMRDALLGIPGALGILDTGTVALERLPLEVTSPPLRVQMQLALVVRADAPPHVMRFVDHVEQTRHALVRAGYEVP